MKLTTAWSTAAVLLLALVACTGSVEEEAPATASIPATAIAVVSTTTPVLPPCSGPADRDSPISNVNAHADADDRSSSDSHACSAYSHPSTDGHPAADGDAHTGTHAYSVTHCHPNAAAQPGPHPDRSWRRGLPEHLSRGHHREPRRFVRPVGTAGLGAGLVHVHQPPRSSRFVDHRRRCARVGTGPVGGHDYSDVSHNLGGTGVDSVRRPRPRRRVDGGNQHRRQHSFRDLFAGKSNAKRL